MMDECVFVRQTCWIRLEMGESLDVYPNMEVIYQEWGRLIYVRGFHLISEIQHAILQICVCVRKGYANECICEGWVKLGECVRGSRDWDMLPYRRTLVSQIVEHTEIDERLGRIAQNLIVEHLFYTISIATNNRTPGIFFHCVNSQTRLTIKGVTIVTKIRIDTADPMYRDLHKTICTGIFEKD